MQPLSRFSLVITMFLACGVGSVADACYCGAARQRACRPDKCCTVAASCCAPQTCTVMVTRREVVYEEVQQTCYKTVYEEVVEKVTVDAVRYVEGTAYRCAPCTVMQPCPPQACAPAKSCESACSPPSSCCDMVPVQVLRKVPYTTARPESYQKVEARPRVVVKQVPYTITVCVPKVVYRQVPVTVCCPVPDCCAKPSCDSSK
jgi:hypothetical protein